jgi:hypothetical protein
MRLQLVIGFTAQAFGRIVAGRSRRAFIAIGALFRVW